MTPEQKQALLLFRLRTPDEGFEPDPEIQEFIKEFLCS